MYDTAIRMPVTKRNSHITLGNLLGGQYGEIIFLPKKRKKEQSISDRNHRSTKPIKHQSQEDDNEIVFSSDSPREIQTFLDSIK